MWVEQCHWVGEEVRERGCADKLGSMREALCVPEGYDTEFGLGVKSM